METRELLGGTEENSVSLRGHWFALQANQWVFTKRKQKRNLVSGQTWCPRRWSRPGCWRSLARSWRPEHPTRGRSPPLRNGLLGHTSPYENSIDLKNKHLFMWIKYLIWYFCSCFCECRQCLSNWEVQTWQMAPCHYCWDSAVLLKFVSLRFMHSTLRYSPKRKGHSKAFLPLIVNHCCDVFKIML